MLTLGLDPGLNNVGYSFFKEGVYDSVLTMRATKGKTPFEKMMEQTAALKKVLNGSGLSTHRPITHVGIEQPYVQGAGGRFGGGGEQSANMWAIYCLLLREICEAHLPVVMFNITQFRSMIIRRRGITKDDVMAKMREELGSKCPTHIDEHCADAYFVSRFATGFWKMMDSPVGSGVFLEKDQQDIFLSTKLSTKGARTGIIYRPGEFWYDFRQKDPLTMTPWLQKYVNQGSNSGA